jgi:hypothetical protein
MIDLASRLSRVSGHFYCPNFGGWEGARLFNIHGCSQQHIARHNVRTQGMRGPLRLLPPLTGLGEEKCTAVACWLIIEAAWVRRLPLVLLKSTVLTTYLQKQHLNAVPPFRNLVV